METVGPARARELEPHLAQFPEMAIHVAEEGAIEPVVAARIMLDDAEARGAKLLDGVVVNGLIQTGNRITGLVTSAGLLEADHVVLAAGAGAVPLAASAGVTLPVDAPPGLIVHSVPFEKRLNGLVLAPELHMRQTSEGRIIAGSDFGGSDPGDDQQGAADALFAKVKAMLTDSDSLTMDFFTVGYRPTPTDGFPIIGPIDDHDGLYVAVMHSGVTLAGGVGALAAAEILSGEADEHLAPFRFA